MKNHYDTLGVAVDATLQTIRKAWKSLVKANHPDKIIDNPDEAKAAEVRLAEVNAAYDVLKDPDKRAAHDREISGQGPGFEGSAFDPRMWEKWSQGASAPPTDFETAWTDTTPRDIFETDISDIRNLDLEHAFNSSYPLEYGSEEKLSVFKRIAKIIEQRPELVDHTICDAARIDVMSEVKSGLFEAVLKHNPAAFSEHDAYTFAAQIRAKRSYDGTQDPINTGPASVEQRRYYNACFEQLLLVRPDLPDERNHEVEPVTTQPDKEAIYRDVLDKYEKKYGQQDNPSVTDDDFENTHEMTREYPDLYGDTKNERGEAPKEKDPKDHDWGNYHPEVMEKLARQYDEDARRSAQKASKGYNWERDMPKDPGHDFEM